VENFNIELKGINSLLRKVKNVETTLEKFPNKNLGKRGKEPYSLKREEPPKNSKKTNLKRF